MAGKKPVSVRVIAGEYRRTATTVEELELALAEVPADSALRLVDELNRPFVSNAHTKPIATARAYLRNSCPAQPVFPVKSLKFLRARVAIGA